MAYKDYLHVCEYIFAVLRTMANGEPLPQKADDISWGAVYSIAKSHSLAGTLFYLLEDEIKDKVPLELFKSWEQTRNGELMQHLNQTAEFAHITSLFTSEKIKFLPIKGFLMKALYPRPEFRTMVDMDIYIPPESYERAKKLLIDNGYKVKMEDGEVHDSLVKPPFINIELHKRIFRGDDEFDIESCNAKEDNPYWYVMSDEDFFVFILRHANKHYVGGGGCGIRTVLDIFLYNRAHQEVAVSDSFIANLKETGIYDFYLDIIALAEYWFSSVQPERDILEIEAFVVTGGTYGSIKNRVARRVKEKNNKFLYALRMIFPAPHAICSRYGWVKKCKILLPVGYIVRIFQSIFNGRVGEYMVAIKESEKRAHLADEIREDKNNTKASDE